MVRRGLVFFIRLSLISILLLPFLPLRSAYATAANAPAGPVAPHLTPQQFGILRLPFIANKGQTDKHVAFYTQSANGAVFVTTEGKLVYTLSKPTDTAVTLTEELINGKVTGIAGAAPSTTTMNFFIGNDASKWQRGVSTYQHLRYGEVYPGVSLVLSVREQSIEKVFTVHPDGDPQRIRLRISGGKTLAVNDRGELEVETSLGVALFSKPVAYQEYQGAKQLVQIAYVVEGDTYGFTIGDYDRRQPLVIDPVLAATFLGGNIGDEVLQPHSMVIDNDDNIYITGLTTSPDFPGTAGGVPGSTVGYQAAFVAKLDKDLTCVTATLLGGSTGDGGYSMALDSVGNVYVAGLTSSRSFPGISGASADPTSTGSGNEGFVVKLGKNLDTLLAATFVGGSGFEVTISLALDRTDHVYVSGSTNSDDFPWVSTTANGYDVFVVKFDQQLSTASAAIILGGSADDIVNDLALNAANAVYVAGSTRSTDFPGIVAGVSADAVFNNEDNTNDGFVIKLDSALQSLQAATFVGGTKVDLIYDMILDDIGRVYVTGYTQSVDLPGISDTSAYRSLNGGQQGQDVFVARLDSNLRSLTATYLGGRAGEVGYALALDRAGQVYVGGSLSSFSRDFPGLSPDDVQSGFSDGFLTKLDAGLQTVLATAIIGGSADDEVYAIAFNSAGQPYVAGRTYSADLSGVGDEAADSTFGDSSRANATEAFVAKVSFAAPPPPPTGAFVFSPSGPITVELLCTETPHAHTLAVTSPGVGVVERGSSVESVVGLTGLPLLTADVEQCGCRLPLDANRGTTGRQNFPASATLEFSLCVQTDADPDCEFVWSSDPARNSDGFNHVRITPLHTGNFPGRIFQLAWEAEEHGGDQDFNDAIVVARVEKDDDRDGLWNDWEQFGIDINGDGEVDLDLPNLGASPSFKDIFVELDYMTCEVAEGDCASGDTHDHRPKDLAVELVQRTFSAAGNIRLHIDVDDAIPHKRYLAVGSDRFNPLFQSEGFTMLKERYFGMTNPRRFAFHYGVFIHQEKPESSVTGRGEIFGNDFVVSYGEHNTSGPSPDLDRDGSNDTHVGTIQQQAGTLMHELGHTLGLYHGGAKNNDTNWKPNYPSIMNYAFQSRGLPPVRRADGSYQVPSPRWNVFGDRWSFFTPYFESGRLSGYLNYSDGINPDLNEAALNEAPGICADPVKVEAYCQSLSSDPHIIDDCIRQFQVTHPCTPAYYLHYRCASSTTTSGSEEQRTLGSAMIDWNCDGDTTDLNVRGDVNGRSGDMQVLRDHNDWQNLVLDFQRASVFEEGAGGPGEESEELGLEDLETILAVNKDSFVRQTTPHANEGANPLLYVNAKDSALAGFSLVHLPDVGVTRAVLQLTLAGQTRGWGATGGNVQIQRLKTDFAEGNRATWKVAGKNKRLGSGPGVTWHCPTDTEIQNLLLDCDTLSWQGGTNTAFPVTARASHTNRMPKDTVVEWDVTADVQAALLERRSDIAWLLSKDGGGAAGQVVYYSKEGARALFGNVDSAPRLVVSFD